MNWLVQLLFTTTIFLAVGVLSTKYLVKANDQAFRDEVASPLKQISGKNDEKLVLSQKQIKLKSQAITVKVISGKTWGSGIIIRQQANIYTVVTSAHVLIFSDDKSYQIQTPDGQTYQANRLETIDFEDKDLGLVQFQSNKEYEVISLSSTSSLTKGEQVFAAGFPIELENQDIKEFYFTDGNIAQFSQNAFGGGYQIGYTNDVKKGMSGGPLLNIRGEVIAINGIHKYPLWGNPYIFSDGSLASEAKQQEMSEFSWAIPINSFLQILPPQFFPSHN